MASSEVDVSYISVACNRTPSSLDWNSKNVVCFGASNAVALFDTNHYGSSRITQTLSKHTGRVNAVRWIRPKFENHHEEIISGSVDCTAIIWTFDNNTYVPTSSLIGHKNAVTVVDAMYIESSNNDIALYAVTGSVDSTVKIWRKGQSDDEFICLQTLNLGNGLCLALRICVLPKVNIPMIACAFDDDKIHLFVESIDNQYERKFIQVETLIGHEDWVRGLDIISLDNKIMLASCSQDTYIRLWSIEQYHDIKSDNDDLEVEKQLFTVGDAKWTISLDAVLAGHEGWVYGVHWCPIKINDSSEKPVNLKLLSSSLDKTLIIWEPDVTDGIEGVWTEKVRVGEVGGNGLGFYGGKFNYSGNSIIGHGYMGSFHIWKNDMDSKNWKPSVICGGHFNEVVDLGWEPNGQFIISLSTDQTTRLHAPWVRKENPKVTWHELARPQVHGHDMSCLAIISKYTIASGAEEKVIRTFQAPHNFISNLQNISGGLTDDTTIISGMPEGASVPSLGLSNKAVYKTAEKVIDASDRHIKDQYPDNYFIATDLHEPPTEETLMQNTLWPEIHKLYGHGYEVFSLAASNDGKLLASACKATTLQHAAILIWDTNTWLQIQSLQSHQLTVTQLAFSPNSEYLLSVSRDRRWSTFKKQSDELSNQFVLVGTTEKHNGIHTRIIWCCSWTHDSNFFATGSRDGKIAVWGKGSTSKDSSLGLFHNATPPLELKTQSITALSFAPTLHINSYLLAVGFESGNISVYKLHIGEIGREWTLGLALNNNMAHHLTVRKLAFRPVVGIAGLEENDKDILQLASASSDHTVKVYSISLSLL